jgi:hypothetical protein
LRAFAFLLEAAAARLLRLLSVRRGLPGLGHGVGKEAQDRFLADGNLAVVEDERRNRLGAGRTPKCVASVFLDRHLPDQVVDTEFGQPLPHSP